MNRTIVILGTLAVWGAPAGSLRGATTVTQERPERETHQEYVARVRRELAQLEAKIKTSDKKAAEAVRHDARELEKDIDKLGKAGERQWAVMRVHVERSMKDLRKACRDLV